MAEQDAANEAAAAEMVLQQQVLVPLLLDPEDLQCLSPDQLAIQKHQIGVVMAELRFAWPQLLCLPFDELTALSPDHTHLGCFNLHCARRGHAREQDKGMRACEDCKRVRYCSVACEKTAYQEQHAVYCKWFRQNG